MTELQGVGLAVFNALAAGHAVVFVNNSLIVGAHTVRAAEHRGKTQGEAGAAAAVADGGSVLKAGSLIYLVDKAVILGTLEYLIRLLLGDKPMLAGLGEMNGVVIEVHAHIIFKMAAALAHDAAGTAAGTGADGDSLGVFNKGGQLVICSRAGVVLNSALNGHYAHHGHAAPHKGKQRLSPAAGILLKALGQHWVLFALFVFAQHALHDARHPYGIVVPRLIVQIAHADNTGIHQLVKLLLSVLHASFAAAGDILHSAWGFKTHVHHNMAHIVSDNGLKDLVFGVVIGDTGVGQTLKTDLRREP